MKTNGTTNTCMDCGSFEVKRTVDEIGDKITIAGFLMTCLIVCYHCPYFDEMYAWNGWDSLLNEQVEFFMEQAASIAMSYFFTITGFLLFKDLSFSNYPRKMRRRVFSLLIPYLLWQCIYFVTVSVSNRSIFSLSQFFQRTFLFEKWPLNGALWYVYAVFLLAIAAPVLLVLFKNKRTGLISTILLVLITRYLVQTSHPVLAPIIDYGYLINILFYLPFYLIGCYLGYFSGENTLRETFTSFLVFLLVSCFSEDVFPNLFTDMTIGLLPLMGLYILPSFPALQNKKIYRLSFLIYAIHAPLLANIRPYLLSDALLEIPMPVFVRNILIRVVALPLTIGLAFCIHAVLKRICPKLLAAISGGRAS